MAKLTTIRIPHALGLEEARSRLDARRDAILDQCRQHGFEVEVGEWCEDGLDFKARAVARDFVGRLEVKPDEILLGLSLPLPLRLLMPVLEPIAQAYGRQLLQAG